MAATQLVRTDVVECLSCGAAFRLAVTHGACPQCAGRRLERLF